MSSERAQLQTMTQDSDVLLSIPAWTNVLAEVTYGPYDVGDHDYLSGVIGIEFPDASIAGVWFRWYADQALTKMVGIFGFGMSGAIPSEALIGFPNRARWLTVTITPRAGACPFAANLFATNRPCPLPFYPPDPILIDYTAETIAAGASTNLFPDDYYAGWTRVYIDCPSALVSWRLMGIDNQNQIWPLDGGACGVTKGWTTIAPAGAWYLEIRNTDSAPHNYDVAATALFTGST